MQTQECGSMDLFHVVLFAARTAPIRVASMATAGGLGAGPEGPKEDSF